MNKQRGLSLIELMVSIALGLVLMAGVTQMFLSSRTTFVSQQGMSRIQETGRLAMEFLARDLRMASYFGCVRTKSPASATAYNIFDPVSDDPAAGLTGLHKDFLESLRGYNSSAAAGAADALADIDTDLGTDFTVVPDSDILVIRGANDRGAPLISTNTSTDIKGYSTGKLSGECVEGFCTGGIAVVSDCSKGQIFKISSKPTDPVANSNTLTLTHDAWDMTSSDRNEYSTRSSVYPVHTVVYFVAASSIDNPNQLPSLWQQVDGVNSELLQGVERLFITYAERDKGKYNIAKNVTNWEVINSVKIEVLVRGLDQKSVDDRQSVTFGVKPDGTPDVFTPSDVNDRVMRQVFKSTLAIRTRIYE